MRARLVLADLAYGAAVGASAGIGLVAAAPVAVAAFAGPAPERVSSVVGARYDNFRPGAGLDTSQVVWGETCKTVSVAIPECDAGHTVYHYSAARHDARFAVSSTTTSPGTYPAETE